MTGVEFENIWAQKIDKSYSQYLSPSQENSLFKESLFAIILSVYNNLSDQESYDDIAPFIKTGAIFNLNNNKIYISPIPISSITIGATPTITTISAHNLITGDKVKFSGIVGITSTINAVFFAVTVTSATAFTISTTTTGTYTTGTGEISETTDSNDVNKQVNNYWALLALKSKFNQTLQLSITSATNTSPIRIGVNKRNNIKTGELINISGVNGNSNANGTRYVKKINTYQYDLYSDKDLANAVGGNGIFGGVGTIKRIHYKSATPYFSSRQISKYSEPSISSPMFDRADMQIKILPSDSICEEITLDYISTPPIDIDVANTIIDLENFYHYDLLIMIADKAKDMFFAMSKDFESLQGEMLLKQTE